ncbi:MAG: DNA-3-methyladenine glycosylase 2 family protein [Bacteroidetes Order II. Incertae sedis bacterium]|nr:DNA-3-methyladenine glycosylase 2 family protein [Bacteroidetes Order II. bacterium]
MLPFDAIRAVNYLSAQDAILATLMHQVGPYLVLPKPLPSVFEALTESIIYQQLSGKAAETIYRRFRSLFSAHAHPTPEEILKTPHDALRGVGISHAKVRAIHDLALKTINHEIPTLAQIRNMSDEVVIEALTKVRGIGPWTVEMMLLFDLGRPDVLPATDLGVQKGFQKTYGHADLPKPAEIRIFAERWRPYRSVASWYMYRALER